MISIGGSRLAKELAALLEGVARIACLASRQDGLCCSG
jgi:hypothetical protein